MSKIETLKKNYEFDRVFKKGTGAAGQFLILHSMVKVISFTLSLVTITESGIFM